MVDGGSARARTLAAAAVDARAAAHEYDGACDWFARAAGDLAEGPGPVLAAEVWVFDPELRRILLVNHRWRGWVPPGGRVEDGETPREAAARELGEETGLRVELLARPAAVTVRSYRRGWAPALGLSYAAVADPGARLAAEPGQPARWTPLDVGWASWFLDDPARIRRHARDARNARLSRRAVDGGPEHRADRP